MATATANGFQTSVKKTADAVMNGDLQAATHNAQIAAKKAGVAAGHAADELAATAQKHPVATGALLVGAGALLGAFLHSLLRPTPSAGQILLRALKDGSTAATESLSSGLSMARRAMR